MTDIYQFEAHDIDGNLVSLSKYRGKVLLIVNVASACGFTGQYAGLQDIYTKYKDHGFEILAFPRNQFGGQEPGDAEEIKTFCSTQFRVTFPIFGKVQVNGRSSHPLFAFLRENAKGILGSTAIKWNFTKFVIDHTGIPLKRFGPRDDPAKTLPMIKKALGQKNKEERRLAAEAAQENGGGGFSSRLSAKISATFGSKKKAEKTPVEAKKPNDSGTSTRKKSISVRIATPKTNQAEKKPAKENAPKIDTKRIEIEIDDN